MKKDLKEKLVNRKIKKPSAVLMTMLMWLLGILNKSYKVQFHYDYDSKSLRGKPIILLSSHASRLEFIYTLYGFKRKDVNLVCGYQNILKKGLYGILIKLGVISKYLYQPDLICVKNMLKVLKRNGAIGLFPEGIQSTSGSMHPINPATAQFIKRSKATVVIATSKGAYMATNRYSSDRKKGYLDAGLGGEVVNESLVDDVTADAVGGVGHHGFHDVGGVLMGTAVGDITRQIVLLGGAKIQKCPIGPQKTRKDIAF